jgi:hypothetical protein
MPSSDKCVHFGVLSITYSLAIHDPITITFADELVMIFTLPNDIRDIAAKEEADLIALPSMSRRQTNVGVVSEEKTS